MRHNSTSQPVVNANVLEINRVLRNTYFLLSLTLLFSAVMAVYSMHLGIRIGILPLIIGMFGCYFLVIATRNSRWGILSAFLFTGFMGFTLGPVLNMYLHAYVNGAALITTALGTTGVIFLSLSAYALVSKKDFSYMAGFISVAILAVFLVSLANFFFQLPMLQLLISGAFAVLMSAFILYQTSAIIHGGERNYIMATVGLYIAIFNLFVSLLQILGAFSGERN